MIVVQGCCIGIGYVGGRLYAHLLFRSYDLHAALRALNNALRQDAENLEVEVDILTEEIDDLQPEAARYV